MTSMKVYEAIANVTKDLSEKGISKDNKNFQQKYNFRGIDDIYNALSATLANNKLCILPRIVKREVTERQTRNGGVLFYTTLTAEFDFVSAEDGSKHTVCTIGEAMDSGDKSSNKAMSAAYKYACLQTFCIPTEGDNDADATTHEVSSTPSRQIETNPFDDFPGDQPSYHKNVLLAAKAAGLENETSFLMACEALINTRDQYDLGSTFAQNLSAVETFGDAAKAQYQRVHKWVEAQHANRSNQVAAE